MGESSLGERLGVQFIEFEKPAAFCLGSSLWDIVLTLCLPGDPSVVYPPLKLGVGPAPRSRVSAGL